MKSKWVGWWVLALLGAFLLYGSYLVLSPFFGPIFMAVILAVVLHPMHHWLLLKTRRPLLTAWLSTLATGLLFLLPLSLLGTALAGEVSRGMNLLTHADLSWLDVVFGWVEKYSGIAAEEAKMMLVARLREAGGSLALNGVRALQGVGSWLLDSVVSLTTVFFLFLGGRDLLEDSKGWIPLRPELIDELYRETRLVLFANVYGVVAVAVAQGGLTGLGLLFAGLPSPFFWGTIAAGLSVLPFIGAGLVWGAGALYLLAVGSYLKASLLALWGVLVVSMADNVIRTLVLSGGSNMNAAVIFFALLGGIDAFGLIGLFVGPLVFALAITVMKLLRQESQRLVVE